MRERERGIGREREIERERGGVEMGGGGRCTGRNRERKSSR